MSNRSKSKILKYEEDQRTLWFLGAYFTLQLSIFIFWNQLSYLMILGLFCLNFLMIVFATLINHNHQHLPMFYNKKLNKITNVFISLIILAPASRLHSVHMYNHHSNFRTDSDWGSYKIVPDEMKGIMRPLYYLWKATETVMKNRALLKIPAQLKKDISRERAWVFAYSAFLMLYSWKMFFFFVFLSSTAGILFLLFLNFENHEHCDLSSEYAHSINFLSPWENWLSFNNGYHAAHHMKPSLHWSKYPGFHQDKLAPYTATTSTYDSIVTYVNKKYFSKN
jgi:beta-carotene hydroxylase